MNIKYGIITKIIIINTYPFVPYILVLLLNANYFCDVSLSCLHVFDPPVPLPEKLHSTCHLPTLQDVNQSCSGDISRWTESKTTILDHRGSSFLSCTSQAFFQILCQWPNFYSNVLLCAKPYPYITIYSP